MQLRKQIELFDTRAFRLVSEKFRSVQFLESSRPVKDANRKLSLQPFLLKHLLTAKKLVVDHI